MRKGYAQLHRAAWDVACNSEMRRHGTRPQTAQGAVADLCAELDRRQKSVPSSPRYWAGRWKWHPQQTQRLISELVKSAGWVIDGQGMLTAPDPSNYCDKVVTESDTDVTSQGHAGAGCRAECDTRVTLMCRSSDGSDTGVTDEACDSRKLQPKCDSNVTHLHNLHNLSSLRTKNLLEHDYKEAQEYISLAITQPGVKSPKGLAIKLWERIRAQSGLSERDQQQLQRMRLMQIAIGDMGNISDEVECRIRDIRTILDEQDDGRLASKYAWVGESTEDFLCRIRTELHELDRGKKRRESNQGTK